MQIDGKFTFKTLADENEVNWVGGDLVCEKPIRQLQINLVWQKWRGGKYFESAERGMVAFVAELEAFSGDDFFSATWIDKPEIGPIERVEGRIY